MGALTLHSPDDLMLVFVVPVIETVGAVILIEPLDVKLRLGPFMVMPSGVMLIILAFDVIWMPASDIKMVWPVAVSIVIDGGASVIVI